MTLYVNTIEFDGRKAVLNSYSPAYVQAYPVMAESMIEQRQGWTARYPNAIVRTEEMAEAECMQLVAEGDIGPLRCLAHEIGQASQA